MATENSDSYQGTLQRQTGQGVGKEGCKAQRAKGRTDSGVPAEQEGNMPLLGPSPGLCTGGQVTERDRDRNEETERESASEGCGPVCSPPCCGPRAAP